MDTVGRDFYSDGLLLWGFSHALDTVPLITVHFGIPSSYHLHSVFFLTFFSLVLVYSYLPEAVQLLHTCASACSVVVALQDPIGLMSVYMYLSMNYSVLHFCNLTMAVL